MKEKFWLDTDIGNDTDDYYALAYLLTEPRVDLLGISTVTADAPTRAAIVRAALAATGREVPIHPGAERPFRAVEGCPIPGGILSPVGPYGAFREAADAAPSGVNAVEAMRSAIEGNPGEVTLVAIGPLSNVAALFTTYPDTARLLRRLVLMGGCFAAEMPLPWSSIEWNVQMDPYAAAAVLSADFPECIVAGLEETSRYECDTQRFALATASAPAFSPNATVAATWSSKLLRFHDVVPLLPLFCPCGTRLARGTVTVDLTEGDLGRTVFTPDENGRCYRVYGGDIAAFFSHMAERFGYEW